MNDPSARPFVRFLARSFDYALAFAIVGLCGIYTLHLHPVLNSMAAGAAWIPVESILLAKWGTSPGKWLLRTNVEPSEGPVEQWWKALDRSFTVFTFGLGCFIPFVGWAAGLKSYWDLHHTGTTSWDRKKFRVSHQPVSVKRYCLLIALGLVALVIPAIRQIY